MPRVNTRVKSTRGKPYTCSICGNEIEAGQAFYYWTFRYGGTRRIHQEHGRPRPSMLTQSRMGEVYAAVENVEDIIGADDWAIDDAQTALEELAAIIEEVQEAYREAAEHFGGQGENAERADELESFLDSVQSVDLSEWDDRDSDEVPACEKCEGNGHVDCDNCGGWGKVSDGTTSKVVLAGVTHEVENIVDCDVCSGSGEVECSECGGTGESPEDESDWRDEAKGAVEEAISGCP